MLARQVCALMVAPAGQTSQCSHYPACYRAPGCALCQRSCASFHTPSASSLPHGLSRCRHAFANVQPQDPRHSKDQSCCGASSGCTGRGHALLACTCCQASAGASRQRVPSAPGSLPGTSLPARVGAWPAAAAACGLGPAQRESRRSRPPLVPAGGYIIRHRPDMVQSLTPRFPAFRVKDRHWSSKCTAKARRTVTRAVRKGCAVSSRSDAQVYCSCAMIRGDVLASGRRLALTSLSW